MSYCQQDNCARVMYQEYLPAVVRWRYPGEAWQKIKGDDLTYSIEQESGKSYDGYPCLSTVNWRADPNPYTPATGVLEGTLEFPVENDEYVLIKQDKLPGNSQCPNIAQRIFITNFERVLLDYAATCHTVTKASELIVCDNLCTFTVFKNNEIVYQETRNVCPEVEKLSAELNQTIKQIEVKKQSDLETIEINQNSIPNNCWNIYLKSGNSSQFVSQICSTGNLPPVYQVICGCDAQESCPPNTCPIQCGNKVCCYGADGVSVKSIDLSSYG